MIDTEIFQSWAQTYGTMCTLLHNVSGSNGKIAFLETLSKWATEFEELEKDTNWEEIQWDEALEEFLTNKLAYELY